MISSVELAPLRAALRLVQRDLDAGSPSGPGLDAEPGAEGLDAGGEAVVAGTGRFRLVATEQGVFVALPDGRFWVGGAGALPLADPRGEHADSAAATVAVAMGAQECLSELLWHRWPRCPEHGATLRAETADGEAVWCCGVGHRVAAVGGLARAMTRPPASPGTGVPAAVQDERPGPDAAGAAGVDADGANGTEPEVV
ncbi:hypothetical protein [Frankia nepalensis]|uniref:Uncharacterized protein n=1 Tax=Frankia nepalensis TaxID=1836974 RepID=A0A937UM94_9ACTN|nr:hypothetical protein [Frankia nepalensis]MBL7497036.1 hypothetical protein [Frankia nepalensis]MBL7510496.1 hypothetical protein [Frankia nepalensis]MBL7628649.1 hypothetical protein [Frankia nepalensis]